MTQTDRLALRTRLLELAEWLHVYHADGAAESVRQSLTAWDAETARADRLERERDDARKTAEIRRRMIDIPTAWELTLATPKDQHHEKCSYRVAAMLCDCAAARVMEHVSGLLSEADARAAHAEKSAEVRGLLLHDCEADARLLKELSAADEKAAEAQVEALTAEVRALRLNLTSVVKMEEQKRHEAEATAPAPPTEDR